MSEPIVEVVDFNGKPVAVVCYEGKVYKFARNEQGQVRCFWWEGRFDLPAVRILNPVATRALSAHGPAPVEPQVRRPIPMPTDFSCKHCGNPFPKGEQVSDKCPNCGESPFE